MPDLTLIKGGKTATGDQGKHGLTTKQYEFCLNYVKGKRKPDGSWVAMTGSDAYRLAYDASNMKPQTVNVQASKLLAHPKVARYIGVLRARREDAVVHSVAAARTFIFEKLTELALEADRDADKLKAIELLGKLDGVDAFKDVQGRDDQPLPPPDQVKAELAKRLRTLFTATGND
jgi:hypothetical protein